METGRIWLWLAAACYAGAAVWGTAVLWRGHRMAPVRVWPVLAAGWVLQTAGMHVRGMEMKSCPMGNPMELAQFLIWSLVLLYFVAGPASGMRMLGVFTGYLAAVVGVLALSVASLDRPYAVGYFGKNPWVQLHASLAVFSYGAAGILALLGAMMLLQHYALRGRHSTGFFRFLPPLVRLDAVGRRLLWTGFVVMTASLLPGAVVSLREPGVVAPEKLLVTVAVWLAYGLLAVWKTWRGMTPVRFAWVVLGLFLAVLGSLAVVDTHRQNREEGQIQRP